MHDKHDRTEKAQRFAFTLGSTKALPSLMTPNRGAAEGGTLLLLLLLLLRVGLASKFEIADCASDLIIGHNHRPDAAFW
jgi:hypothetical protein